MMDEPLGALDSEFRELMCQELRALHDRLHATTVYVTHDQLEAMAMADTIAIMMETSLGSTSSPFGRAEPLARVGQHLVGSAAGAVAHCTHPTRAPGDDAWRA